MTKTPQHHSANMIFHIGQTSIYIANKIKYLKFSWFPRYSYFDGGSYFKLSFYWFYALVEFSRPKKNKCVYKKISFEKMNEILEKEFKKEKTKTKNKKNKSERILLNE
jgi:hypothetical protein